MPNWQASARVFLSGAGLEATREAEIAEELAQHLEARHRELVAGGQAPEAAERAVLAELRAAPAGQEWRRRRPLPRPALPPLEAFAPETRAAGTLAAAWRDLRYGARLLARAPGFALVAILSLALGIGANAAIFQVLDSLVLRALPVRDPQQLAQVRTVDRSRSGYVQDYGELTYSLYLRIAAEQLAFSALGAWGTGVWNLARGGQVRYAQGMWVSGNLFGVLGIVPARGRLIGPADDQPGCDAPGAVLSYRFWQSEFAGAGLTGKAISLNGRLFPIVGVTPPHFTGLEVGNRFDVALPLCAERLLDGERILLDNPQGWWLEAIGRLRPGWSLPRASAQLAAISPAILAATMPPQYDAPRRAGYLRHTLTARTAADGFSELREQYEEPLCLLLGLAGLVLLVACANLANLLLARAAARQPELALRLALGASRGVLVRQLLVESLLLAAAGAIGGVAVSAVCSRALLPFFATGDHSAFLNLAPDWRLIAFLAALATLACLLFGLAPALAASRTAPAEALKSGGRGAVGRGSRLRHGLVVVQVALSLILLVGALLFVGTLRNLMAVNTGFDKTGILIADLDLTPLRLPSPRRIAYGQHLLARLRQLPGVASAALVDRVPQSGDWWNEEIAIGGARQRPEPMFDRVSPGYFATVGTPLLAGRDFAAADSLASPRVAIVTRAFARQFFAGANPIGRAFRIEQDRGRWGPLCQIVGLAGDYKYNELRAPDPPVVFLAQAQDDHPGLYVRVALRAQPGATGLPAEVRQAVIAINPAIGIEFYSIATLLADNTQGERLTASLASCFGGLAVLLALVGLYGVISYQVVRRRGELGVRLALGATRGRIVGLIFGEAALLLAMGLGIGAILAALAAGAARSLLFGVRPADPRVMAAAIAGLALAGLGAAWLPAHRAATLDPMRVLREE